MVAIGFGLAVLGYWLGVAGFSLVKGYDNRPLDLINPFFHGQWSTSLYKGTAIFPGGAASTSQASGAGAAAGAAAAAAAAGLKPTPAGGKGQKKAGG